MKAASMNLTSFDLIRILRDKVGEDQAAALASYVETRIKEEIESNKEGFATKEDIARLETKIEISKVTIILWVFGMLVTLLGLATSIILKFMK